MGLLIAFVIFTGTMITMLITGHTMVWALLVGLFAFGTLGLIRLHREKSMGFAEGIRLLSDYSRNAIKDSLVVIGVMLSIGILTASWRVSGTITIFVYWGMKIIVPPLFLIITFLLTCLLSYALGTSFGVAGTLGVIFMALARSGGVNPVITAGVLMSGIYFGDRCSPVSSSANMVAGITGTQIYDNIKFMIKSAGLPFAITLAAYIVLSLMNPITGVDQEIMTSFRETFSLSPWAFVPAILMFVLPLLKLDVFASIGASAGSAVLVAWLVQGVPILKVLKACVLGYVAEGEGLGAILNGGGLVSMIEIAIILTISCAYSGIFNATGMLDGVQDIIKKGSTRFGRYLMTLVVGTLSCVVFCNQTIATLMTNDLMTKPYLDTGGSRQELAIDMENTLIVIAGLVPWAIACSVPLGLFGMSIAALPFAFYMYLIPICYIFTKKKWFNDAVADQSC